MGENWMGMRHAMEQRHNVRARAGRFHGVTEPAALAVVLFSLVLATPAETAPPAETHDLRPFGTYSIVARDPETQQIGVAVQSHFFAVGAVVTWAWPGIGAVASQANGAARFGPEGLAMLADGVPPNQAIQALLASDPLAETRQVGMVDGHGRSHAHTGQRVIGNHCQHTAPTLSIQANIMANRGVCSAMADAFTSGQGDLAARLFAALEAAQAVGGDLRGKQAAALLVVEGDDTLPRWGGRVYDIRVDNSPAPLRDLDRMITIARDMNLSTVIQADIRAGWLAEASDNVSDLRDRVGPEDETFVWIAASYAAVGEDAAAMALLQPMVSAEPKWRETIARLIAAGYLPDREPFTGLSPVTSSVDAPGVPSSRASPISNESGTHR